MTPVRVQRSRKAGSKLPPNTVCVTRGPGMKFGNPFTLKAAHEVGYKSYTAQHAVNDFFDWVRGDDRQWSGPTSDAARALLNKHLHELRGKNLACFCPLDQPCHADVLLELANR